MKLFIIAFLSFHFGFFDIQEDKMSGKYKMEYEEKFSTQNCVITIKDSTYERKLLNGKTVKGKSTGKRPQIDWVIVGAEVGSEGATITKLTHQFVQASILVVRIACTEVGS